MKLLTLTNGRSMPALGLGTWDLRGRDCREAAALALKLGYRHIDTAEMYGNEAEIGEAFAASGVPRGELFVTTKVWTNHFRAAELKKAAEESLRKLRLSHVDLLLLHWPYDAVPLAETLGALCAEAKAGRALAVGVSNYDLSLLKKAEALADVPLACNQVKYSLGDDLGSLLPYARSKGVVITAYTPLDRGKIVRNRAVLKVAGKHGKTPAQVALNWLVRQEGVAAIPKATGETHLRENLDVLGFELDKGDLAALDGD